MNFPNTIPTLYTKPIQGTFKQKQTVSSVPIVEKKEEQVAPPEPPAYEFLCSVPALSLMDM